MHAVENQPMSSATSRFTKDYDDLIKTRWASDSKQFVASWPDEFSVSRFQT